MSMRQTFGPLLLSAFALVAALALPSPARAWWRGGVFFAFPPVVPYYYPPPVVYPPPPVVYYPPVYPPPPPYPAAPQAGAGAPSCRAGAYVCPLETPAAIGAPCSCPTNTGRIAGQVG
jgi:hypothetical protein